jgi:hypothetical protein
MRSFEQRSFEQWQAERAAAEASVAEIRRFLGWPYARDRPRDPAKRELLARIGVPQALLGPPATPPSPD